MLIHVVDGFLRDTHAVTVESTTYNVESGLELTDHAVKRPNLLSVEGWVSNLVPTRGVSEDVDLDDRAALAWQEIEDLAGTLEPMVVTTAIREYESMLLLRARTRQDEKTGRGLLFTLDFREVRFSALRAASDTVVGAPGSDTEDRFAVIDRGRVATVDASGTVIII